jgi:hypothetical protein
MVRKDTRKTVSKSPARRIVAYSPSVRRRSLNPSDLFKSGVSNPAPFLDLHVFVQLNDLYFLDTRADYSKPGGLLLPRIATMVKDLKGPYRAVRDAARST